MTIPHDIYVFGTQENSVGDREWLDLLRGGLKELTDLDYRPVRGGHLVQFPLRPPQTILLDLMGNPGEHYLTGFPSGVWANPLGDLTSPSCYGNIALFLSGPSGKKGNRPFCPVTNSTVYSTSRGGGGVWTVPLPRTGVTLNPLPRLLCSHCGTSR